MGAIPFEFKSSVSILKATGKKASTLRELLGLVSEVSDESVFHHTYQYFLKGHELEYTNDFAHWSGESLEERALSEHLSNIDPYAYRKVRDLRREIVRVMTEYLERFPEPREALHGDEFHFNETVTIIFPAGVVAKNLAEFLAAIKYVDPGSIYFHFYEARMRLGGGVDDFSRWIEDVLLKSALSARIRAIDPFMHDIEGVRRKITALVEEEVRRDMEVIPE